MQAQQYTARVQPLYSMTSGVLIKELRDLRVDGRGASELHVADTFFKGFAEDDNATYERRFSELARLCLNASVADQDELNAVSDAILLILRRQIAPRNRVAVVASLLKLVDLSERIKKTLAEKLPGSTYFEGEEDRAAADNILRQERSMVWEKFLEDYNVELIGFAMAWLADTRMLTFARFKGRGSDPSAVPLELSRDNKIARNLSQITFISDPVLQALPETGLGYIFYDNNNTDLAKAQEFFRKLASTLDEKIEALLDHTHIGSDARFYRALSTAAVLAIAGAAAQAPEPFKPVLALDPSFGGNELPLRDRMRLNRANAINAASTPIERLIGKLRSAVSERNRVFSNLELPNRDNTLQSLDTVIREAAEAYYYYIMAGEFEERFEVPSEERKRAYDSLRDREFADVVSNIDDPNLEKPASYIRSAILSYMINDQTNKCICYAIPADLALFALPIAADDVFDRPFVTPFYEWSPVSSSFDLEEEGDKIVEGHKRVSEVVKEYFKEKLAKNVLGHLYVGDPPGLVRWKKADVAAALRDAPDYQRKWWTRLYFHLAKSPLKTLGSDYLIYLEFPPNSPDLTDAQKMQLKIEGVRLMQGIRSTITLPESFFARLGSIKETDRLWLNSLPDGALSTFGDLGSANLVIALTSTQYDITTQEETTPWNRLLAYLKKNFLNVFTYITNLLKDAKDPSNHAYIKAPQLGLEGDQVMGIATANWAQTVEIKDDLEDLAALNKMAPVFRHLGGRNGGENVIAINGPVAASAISNLANFPSTVTSVL